MAIRLDNSELYLNIPDTQKVIIENSSILAKSVEYFLRKEGGEKMLPPPPADTSIKAAFTILSKKLQAKIRKPRENQKIEKLVLNQFGLAPSKKSILKFNLKIEKSIPPSIEKEAFMSLWELCRSMDIHSRGGYKALSDYIFYAGYLKNPIVDKRINLLKKLFWGTIGNSCDEDGLFQRLNSLDAAVWTSIFKDESTVSIKQPFHVHLVSQVIQSSAVPPISRLSIKSSCLKTVFADTKFIDLLRRYPFKEILIKWPEDEIKDVLFLNMIAQIEKALSFGALSRGESLSHPQVTITPI